METLEVLGVEKDVSRLFQATGTFPKSREFRCNLRNQLHTHIYIYIYTYIISSLSAGKPRSLLERTATSRLSRAPAGPGASATLSKKPAPIAPPRAREETAIILAGPGISSGNS